MLWMWELDYKESWAQKNSCFWTVVLEKTLESPLDCKEIQPVHPKGDVSWVFIGRTDAEAETPILWSPTAKNWLIWKDPDAGKDWRQEEKGTTRGWDGWMASPTQWIWVWVNSGSWWWTGRPGVLQNMGSQRVGHDWATELTDSPFFPCTFPCSLLLSIRNTQHGNHSEHHSSTAHCPCPSAGRILELITWIWFQVPLCSLRF